MNLSSLNKEQRFNQMNEMRKLKREDMIIRRRGLNFVSDSIAESIAEEAIE